MELCLLNVLADAYKYSSNYLLTSVALAVASVLFVWLYEKPAIGQFFSKLHKETEVEAIEESAEEGEEECGEQLGVRIDARSLVEQISADMTPEQREYERVVEQEQLAAIYQLLREEEDKFNVSSMEQLKEQLNLYR